jgi:hypothetical protein
LLADSALAAATLVVSTWSAQKGMPSEATKDAQVQGDCCKATKDAQVQGDCCKATKDAQVQGDCCKC